jgi:hypothetical protein
LTRWPQRATVTEACGIWRTHLHTHSPYKTITNLASNDIAVDESAVRRSSFGRTCANAVGQERTTPGLRHSWVSRCRPLLPCLHTRHAAFSFRPVAVRLPTRMSAEPLRRALRGDASRVQGECEVEGGRSVRDTSYHGNKCCMYIRNILKYHKLRSSKSQLWSLPMSLPSARRSSQQLSALLACAQCSSDGFKIPGFVLLVAKLSWSMACSRGVTPASSGAPVATAAAKRLKRGTTCQYTNVVLARRLTCTGQRWQRTLRKR